MAGFVLIARRDYLPASADGAMLTRLAHHLSPDNIRPNPPHVLEQPGLARVVVNPVPSVRANHHGALLGALFEEADWAALGSAPPDGVFAIVRHDADRVELLTDLSASRTVWYLHGDDVFVASTSQRALIALLGDYRPNPEAATWMASTGNLGWNHGWDERLQRVPSATCLRLDRRTWSVTTTRTELSHEPRDLPEREHLDRLRDGVFAACAALRTDDATTALTLSGGHDSRSLLAGLAHSGRSVTCLTWGLPPSLADPRNDAFIARRLTERFGMSHEYLVLDPDDLQLDPDDRVVRDGFSRFLRAGEGRIDDFRGYTDGLDTWRHIFESGFSVVLRGDAPGWGLPHNPIDTVWTRAVLVHAALVDDYPEDELIHTLGLAPQSPPDWLSPAEGETLDGYRDRIYDRFATPACLAAWNQVKCAYVEMVSPLFARRIVMAASELPDDLRHLRCGFNRVVDELVPDVPYATHEADEPLTRYLRRKPVEAELLAELSSDDARKVFSVAALDAVVACLERPSTKAERTIRGRVRALVPNRLVRAVRPVPRLRLDSRHLAYRMYVASRMAAILREDATFLSEARGAATR